MEHTTAAESGVGYQRSAGDHFEHNEAHSSGVSWSAVLAGAIATAALALILLSLGTGLGLSSVSLWSNVGASASTIGASAIIWMIFMQIASSALGGYLAGRLRTKWSTIHTDEVYFRDTAHGFLSWSVATVLTAAFLASAAASLMGSANNEKAPMSSAATAGQDFGSNAYFVDTLFRSDSAKTEVDNGSTRREAGIILLSALKQGDLSSPDKSYLDQLVVAKTGLSASDADKRVSDTFAADKDAGEAARKALAHSLLWAFAALLIGAFCASFAATIGGRQRDHVVTI
jgi:hypothetical protein